MAEFKNKEILIKTLYGLMSFTKVKNHPLIINLFGKPLARSTAVEWGISKTISINYCKENNINLLNYEDYLKKFEIKKIVKEKPINKYKQILLDYETLLEEEFNIKYEKELKSVMRYVKSKIKIVKKIKLPPLTIVEDVVYLNFKNDVVGIIDLEDLHLIENKKLYIGKSGYIKIGVELLHKKILPNLKIIDHKNRNKLDNRKINLREATVSQNQVNIKPRNKLGIKGIYYDSKFKIWKVAIKVNNKTLHTVRIKNIKDAIDLRISWEKLYQKEFRYEWEKEIDLAFLLDLEYKLKNNLVEIKDYK